MIPLRRLSLLLPGVILIVGFLLSSSSHGQPKVDLEASFAKQIRPLIKQYCLECHSAKKPKGDLDLERFTSLGAIKKDYRPWEHVIEQVEVGEMPPKDRPQPTADEKKALLAWVKDMLASEARARAGDPGRVALRRLNNAEFTNTVRDLTGVDLEPAKEFPADSAAGEGFANTGETLAMSPTLIDRYLKSAKDIASHAVLLPDGFRFTAGASRRDASDEVVAKLNAFYAPYKAGGPLSPEKHWAALLRHLDALAKGTLTPQTLAARENLSPVYLETLSRDFLKNDKATFLVDRARGIFIATKSADELPTVVAQVGAMQKLAWKRGAKVAHYTRFMEPLSPVAAAEIALPLESSKDGQDVVITLDIDPITKVDPGYLVLRNPRLTHPKSAPIALADVAGLVTRLETHVQATLANTDKYLDAVVLLRDDPKADAAALAKSTGLDEKLLGRWAKLAALPAKAGAANVERPVPLKLMTQKSPGEKKHINGWSNPSGEKLPTIVSNSSNADERIPGLVNAHKVVLHPTPTQFAGVGWSSPFTGPATVTLAVHHNHPTCGNGVAWWIEHRQGDRVTKLDKGLLGLGEKSPPSKCNVAMQKGDVILIAIAARDNNHFCDLTGVDVTIAESGEKGRTWDLAKDVADTILESNPHIDGHGNKDIWQFVFGDDSSTPAAAKSPFPAGSALAAWRDAGDAGRRAELARKVRDLLTTETPMTNADRETRALITSLAGPLFDGLDPKTLPPAKETKDRHGVDPARFGKHPSGKTLDANQLVIPAAKFEIRLPASLAAGRQFVAEVSLDPISKSPPMAQIGARASSTQKTSAVWVRQADPAVKETVDRAVADFQTLFPAAMFFPNIVPSEGGDISLRLYYREDEPLMRLMLDDAQRQTLDRLWAELHFISRDAIAVYESFDLFIGFASQVGLVPEFEPFRKPVTERAEAFKKQMILAEPKQVAAIVDFAARAYRRPLADDEKKGLTALYQAMRKKDVPHEEAFRSTLARVFASPHFLYRLETAPDGAKAGPVADRELATRLSYFLWASMPDEELSLVAAKTALRDSKTLRAQAERMLKAKRVRGLATEFGMQWLGVRDILDHKEKSETLFPMFNDDLRKAEFEESALFFQDLFENDRSVLGLIDCDHTFVNETLAKHYGIPGVKGPEWRKFDGAKKFGRGGVLTLSAVLTKQAGASRTSPILRGNWIVDTLLGEKLPRPPANVPQLPEAEDTSKLTVRQLIELHTKDAACANCHRRIDPFGFALENYDPIGRWRQKDLAGRPLETKAVLRDGATFDGVDGLRQYLLKNRRDEFLRTFCRKLLGYSLGRSVMLSDQPLIDEMIDSLRTNDYRVSAAIVPIVLSPQFRNIRGADFVSD